jgi:endoglucanase
LAIKILSNMQSSGAREAMGLAETRGQRQGAGEGGGRPINRRAALYGAAALAACAQGGAGGAPARAAPRRAVNLGNGLEAPNEGDWGYRVEISHLDAIADAGFDGVRLPVRWDTHMDAAAPFAIDPAFFARVDEILSAALARGLKVQLNAHHYAAMLDAPDAETPRYQAMWRQIAEHYADMPDELSFEPLNEPHGAHWTGARVTQSQVDALATIRPSNPTRLVVVGGPSWNAIGALAQWIPPDDPHLVATAHYYEPHAFTHQGASWEHPPPRYPGRWGKAADMERLSTDIASAAHWARAHGLGLQIGEFGVISAVAPDQRALWTQAVRKACEHEGLGWAVWDFAGAFAIYDVEAGAFRPEMLRALLG